MREIVLDTETTGLKPEEGHRVIEIGCVELLNHVPTGQHFHVYLNPERDVPPDATAIHGITNEFLADKPVFRDSAQEFLDMIGDATLVIHNASFDMAFLNWEMVLLERPKLTNPVIDTLSMARRKFPGSPATLDALCRRFGIDNSGRTFHGALLDAQLLAEVYLELQGGRQTGLDLATAKPVRKAATVQTVAVDRTMRPPRPHAPSPEELEAHEALIAGLKNPLWRAE
jgi:DNA polymerase III subunit epsilon